MPGKTRSKKTINVHFYDRRQKQGEDLIDHLVRDMEDYNTDPNILVPINSKVQLLEEDLVRKSYIVVGPAGSGKTCAILWACRGSSQQRVIKIDCRLYQSDMQFIQCLTKQFSFHINPTINKRIVSQQNIDFTPLNELIEMRKQKYIILIKHAQKLAQSRKQILLYTIFEWIHNSNTNQSLKLVISTRKITFIDKIQKRVRSRMSSQLIFIGRPTPNKVLEIIQKRINYRIQCTKSKKEVQMLIILRTAVTNNKQLDKTLKKQYDLSTEAISFYLSIMRYIIINDIATVDKWADLTQDQTNRLVSEGFKKYSEFIADYRKTGSYMFANCSKPEIILMGLIHKNFLLQKDDKYRRPMNYSTLISEFALIKSRVVVQTVGNSFFYQESVMEDAYIGLKNKGLISFSQSDNSSLDKKEMYCQFSPEDIEEFYNRMVQQMPQFIKDIYGVIIKEEIQ